MDFIREIKTLSKNDAAIAGGKGAALGEMIHADFRVPNGFVILMNAFEIFLKSTGIEQKINIPESRGQSDLIRKQIISTPIPEDISQAIIGKFRELGLKKAAVRSSATVEDGSKSAWAGQFQSFLNTEENNLLENVKKCWASRYNERVFKYGKNKKVNIENISVAVVVQEMIDAYASGISFSKNPLSLNDDTVVIEAGFGPGESFVSGKVTPDKYLVKRKPERILNKLPATGKQVLSDTKIIKLSRQILKAEEHFGYPVDAEWALDKNGEFWIIQARPITSATNDSEIPAGTWSNVNLSEVAPGAIPPLVSDALIEIVTPAFCAMLGSKEELKIIGVIKGHLYFNILEIQKIFQKTVGESFAITDVFGGSESGTDKTFAKVSLPAKIRFGLFVLKAFIKSFSLKRNFEQNISAIRSHADRFSKLLQTINTPPELMDFASQITRYLKKIMVFNLGGLFAQISLFFVSLSLFKKWLNQNDNRLANEFYASGGAQLQMVQAFSLLWGLSRQISADERLKKNFLETESPEKAVKLLENQRAVRELWDIFMKEYGHRTINEINFSLPRWSEDTSFIISTLKNYIKAKNNLNPSRRTVQLKQKQQKKLKQNLSLLPWWKSFILRKLLKMGRRGLGIREYAKTEAMRVLVPLRAAYLKIGTILAAEQLLDKPQDIFMLTQKEIDTVLVKKTDMRAAISGRKIKYENYTRLEMPEFFSDKNAAANEVIDDKPVLKGLAVSHGKIKGTARVITDIKEIRRVQPGDILVTDHTDPGWTPTFVIIGGVITNVGGLLSHAAIVAREYGLPAIVNVKNATKFIRDGQTVLLDGNTGEIHLF